MSYTARDLIEPAREKLSFLKEQETLLKEEATSFDDDVARLEALLARTRDELAGYLLGDVEDEALADLEERLRYPELTPLKRASEAKLAQAQAELAELETKEDVKNYEFHVSQAQDQREEIRPVYEELRRDEEAWTSLPGMNQLVGEGYFDDDYRAGLWRRFGDWKRVSQVLDALDERRAAPQATEAPGGELTNPAELRAAWREHRGQADSIFPLWEQLTARQDELKALGERVAALRAAPQTLFDELYAELSRAVLDHLDSCPEELLLELAKGDKYLVTFLKKYVGVTKQLAYLRQLRSARVDQHLQSLEAQRQKLERKIRKYERKPWKPKSASELTGLRKMDRDKWARRRQKIGKVRTRVAGFHKYDKGAIGSDYLWWDVISGHARGDDLYEVRTFREAHPGWDYRTYDDGLRDDGLSGGALRDGGSGLAEDAMDQAAAALTLDALSDDDLAFDGS